MSRFVGNAEEVGAGACADRRLLYFSASKGSTVQKEIRCDFCNSVSVIRHFPCASFGMNPLQISEDWMACERCANLIDADRWDDLLDVSIDSEVPMFADLSFAFQVAFRDAIHHMHHKFRRLRFRNSNQETNS